MYLRVVWKLLVCMLLVGYHASAEAVGERGELFAHPDFTQNGCPRHVALTDAVVNEALGLQPRMLQRLKNRFGITKERLCDSAWYEVEAFVRQAKSPKHNADQADRAQQFRAMQQRDENGAIGDNALKNAVAQRNALLASTPNANAPLPNAAGVTSASWTWIGPGNIGGRVRAILPHPAIAGEILVGGVSGGIWKTNNGGTTWFPINDFLPNVAVSCLVRDPADVNVIYACTGEGFFSPDAVRGLGIFKSTDNGNTWAQLPATDPVATGNPAWYFVNRLVAHPLQRGVMLAATNAGVFRTLDGGASWTRVYGEIAGSNNFRRVLDIAFQPGNGNVLVLGEGYYFDGTANGAAVAYSGDGGATWSRTRLNTAAIPGIAGRVEIAFARSNITTVYAMVDINNGELYKSVDSGQTWTPNSPVGTPAHLGGQGWYNNAIWVAPNDANRIIAGGVTMTMSINGGTSWTVIGNNVHADHHIFVEDPNYASSFTIYGGNDGGVYRATSVNTATPAWTPLNNDLGITQFYGGAGKSGGRIVGGTQDNGSLMWTGSTNWVSVFGADGGDSAADPVDGNYVYGEAQLGGVHRYTQALSATGNVTSEVICNGIADADCIFGQNANPRINFVAPLKLDPNDPNRLLLGAERLWRTNNAKAPASSVAWTAIKPVATPNNNISAIAVASGNSNIIWVGYNNGELWCTNDGTAVTPAWTRVAGTPGRFVTRITIDETTPSRVFVANGGYSSPNLHVTFNGCVSSPSFANIHGQLPAAPIRAIVRHPVNPNWLYAGTEVGIFSSEDGGNNWTTNNDGPGTVSVEELFFLDNTLLAATHGRGMFAASISATGPGIVSFSKAAQTVFESAGFATVAITRTGATAGAVSVGYATVAGTASSAGGDYNALAGTLTWQNGESGSKFFAVPLLNDAIVEADKSFTIVLQNPTGGVSIGGPSVHTVTITDDDSDAFPRLCQLPAGWSAPASANAGWGVSTSARSEGKCSLKSNAIADGQKAQIQFTGSFNAGLITFTRKVSSEPTFDCFRFYVDGAAQAVSGTCDGTAGASGELGWTPISVPVTAGNHTLTWSYEKDGFQSAGADAAWIDAVSLPIAPLVLNRKNDFNGDFRSDIVYRDLRSGEVSMLIVNGVTTATPIPVLTAGTGWTVSHIADVDGDGRADLITRNTDGRAALMIMNGASVASTTDLLPAGGGWTITHAADLNGDGKADFVLKNVDGRIAVLIMNGTIVVSYVELTAVGAPYTPTHTGDFNGDGKADIVLRHTDGSAVILLMNGAVVSAASVLLNSNGPWTVTHIADLNGDGRTDVVIRNADGSAALLLMNGITVTSAALLLTTGSPYTVTHTGDFDGDGKTDLLIRSTDGAVALLQMNGAVVNAATFLLLAGATTSVVQVADYNGDGKSDILLRNADGSVTAILMNGGVVTAAGTVLGAGTLQIVP